MKTIALLGLDEKEIMDELEEIVVEEIRIVPTCRGNIGFLKSSETTMNYLSSLPTQEEKIEDAILEHLKNISSIEASRSQIEEIGIVEEIKKDSEENKKIHKKIYCYTIRVDAKQKKISLLNEDNKLEWKGLKKAYHQNKKIIKENPETDETVKDETRLLKVLMKKFSRQSSFDVLIDFAFELFVFVLAILLWAMMQNNKKFSNVDIDVYIFIASVLILFSAIGSDFVMRHLRRKRNSKHIIVKEVEEN